MNRGFLRILVGMVVLSAAGLLLAAEFVVCRKCGYENKAGDVTCLHCRAELPPPPPDAPAPADAQEGEGDRKLKFLDGETVEEELRQGEEQFRAGAVELARLFLRNAAALELLTDAAVSNSRAARIAVMIGQCERAAQVVRRPCPECNGSGHRSVKTQLLTGETSVREGGGGTCLRCKGAGYILGQGTTEEHKLARGRAQQKFGVLQPGRKYSAVGNAWVPVAIKDRLTVRQTTSLKRATADPCSDCGGIGKVTCRACKGTGTTKCPNPDCKNGRVPQDESSQLVGTRLRADVPCKRCDGKGFVPCVVCTGSGGVLCQECNGTGARPLCRRCGGEGSAPCRACEGTGTFRKAPCTKCGGEGAAPCSQCNGDGHKP